MPDTKICRECGVEKLLAEFYPRSGQPGHFHPKCKPCFKACVTADKRSRRSNGPKRNPAPRCDEPGHCTKCGSWLPADSFWPRFERPGLRQTICKPCITTRRRKARRDNPEKTRAISRVEYWQNPARRAVYSARGYARRKTDPAWMQRNRQRALDWYHKDIKASRRRRREDYSENIGRIRAYQALRRYKIKLGGVPFTGSDLREILRLQRGRCAICRKRISGPPSPDHIIPVCDGGTNDRRNIQATHLKCNISKNGSDQILFMRSRFGRLL